MSSFAGYSELRRRFEASLAAAKAKEAELVQNYRARMAELKSFSEVAELEKQLYADHSQYYPQYRREVMQLAADCHEHDMAFLRRLQNLKLTLSPREKTLYDEALEAVKKEIPPCDCLQWHNDEVRFEALQGLTSELPRSF